MTPRPGFNNAQKLRHKKYLKDTCFDSEWHLPLRWFGDREQPSPELRSPPGQDHGLGLEGGVATTPKRPSVASAVPSLRPQPTGALGKPPQGHTE